MMIRNLNDYCCRTRCSESKRKRLHGGSIDRSSCFVNYKIVTPYDFASTTVRKPVSTRVHGSRTGKTCKSRRQKSESGLRTVSRGYFSPHVYVFTNVGLFFIMPSDILLTQIFLPRTSIDFFVIIIFISYLSETDRK